MCAFEINHRSARFLCVVPVKTSVIFPSQKKDPKLCDSAISALILSALPFLMYGATTITAPNYYSSVSDDPKFTVMAVPVVVLVTGNAVLLRRLVTFKF
jgi:Flp pilus assembly protein TadB